MAHVFFVGDNDSIQESVRGYLKLADYSVSCFTTLRSLKNALKEQLPDLILLDVILPDGDGFIFAKELLAVQKIPLIFVTSRESESDRITGFEVGADDYVVKPFSPKELVLRIAAVLKRVIGSSSKGPQHRWILKGLELCSDEESHKITLNGEILNLTVAEWKILLYLGSNRGIVVTREQILDHCLEYSFDGYDRTVDTHIKNLRAKLGQAEWIETVRGYGYRFAGEAG